MFSGIIEHIGGVTRLSPAQGGMRLSVDVGPLANELAIGASVAVNGVCLTVAVIHRTVCEFDAVPETLSRTNLGRLRVGQRLNLERSLRASAPIDGHFVQGHVECVGTLEQIDRNDGAYKLTIRVDPDRAPYITPKGAIAIDGVSLTVVDAEPGRFSVVLIPTTLERSTLGERRSGDELNIETDIMARIIVARVDAVLATGSAPAAGAITIDQLRSSGFAT
ncbi:MAG: riboflavin synthase [Phycisphaerae bacterium]